MLILKVRGQRAGIEPASNVSPKAFQITQDRALRPLGHSAASTFTFLKSLTFLDNWQENTIPLFTPLLLTHKSQTQLTFFNSQ